MMPSMLIKLMCVIVLLFTALVAVAQDYQGKKILYVNSYHQGYGGSDPITQGVQDILGAQGVDLKTLYMDTKRNPDEAFIKSAALQVKGVIEEWQPEMVIASDDNASKYLIMPYYKDAALPFVFCGVNWDASVYGFPYQNVTGMIEVALVSEILKHLKKYAKGERIGFIAGDRLSERKNLEHYQTRFNIVFEKAYFAKTFEDWKASFAKLQDEVDMIMMTSHAGVEGWDDQRAKEFVEAQVKIPVGSEHQWEMPLALVGVTKDFEEMGIWSARAALKILDGVAPSKIPVTANKKGQLFFNTRIAAKLGISEIPAFATLVD